MTSTDILARLDALGAEVSINRFVWSPDSEWVCRLSLDRDGLKLEGKANGLHFSDALHGAWAKLSPFLETAPGKALCAPTINALPTN